MTEIALKEIPVQILSVAEGDVLIVRVPADWDGEQMYLVESVVRESLSKAGKNIQTCCIGKNIDLAVVRNIIKAHKK